MTTTALSDLLSRLEGVRPSGKHAWMARCPAHPDRNPSLSIALGSDDRVLMHCHAGCTVWDITGAVGMDVADLFSDRDAKRPGAHGAGRIPAHLLLTTLRDELTAGLVAARALQAESVTAEDRAFLTARLASVVERVTTACDMAGIKVR